MKRSGKPLGMLSKASAAKAPVERATLSNHALIHVIAHTLWVRARARARVKARVKVTITPRVIRGTARE